MQQQILEGLDAEFGKEYPRPAFAYLGNIFYMVSELHRYVGTKVTKSLDPQRYLFFYYEKGGVFYAPFFK